MGEQPRTKTQIMCLECGRWLRAMATHLARAHDMTAEEYKLAHGLLLKEPLMATDLVERGRELGKLTAATNPSAGIEAIRAGRTRPNLTEAAARSARRRAQNPEYGQALKQARDQGALYSERARQRHEETARAAGFDSWEALLRATVDESAQAVAARLGMTEMTISEARRTVLGADWRSTKAPVLQQRAAQKREALARAHGHESWTSLIADTRSESAAAVAKRIGVSEGFMCRQRRAHDHH